jgi:hypothetical protein
VADFASVYGVSFALAMVIAQLLYGRSALEAEDAMRAGASPAAIWVMGSGARRPDGPPRPISALLQGNIEQT